MKGELKRYYVFAKRRGDSREHYFLWRENVMATSVKKALAQSRRIISKRLVVYSAFLASSYETFTDEACTKKVNFK